MQIFPNQNESTVKNAPDVTFSELRVQRSFDTCLVGRKIGYLQGKEPNYTSNVRLIDMQSSDQVLEAARSLGASVILPIDLTEQEIVVRAGTWLKGHGVTFAMSPWSTIMKCNDKGMFVQAMTESGLRHFLPNTLQSLSPGCIAKKTIDDWGKSSYLVTTQDDVTRVSALLRGVDYIIQEYIPGDHEYASHVLASKGVIRAMATFRNWHETAFYVQGIQSPETRSERVDVSAQVRRSLAQVLAALDYTGMCCFDYKLGSDGLPRIFEVNPRVGATLGVNRELFTDMMGQYVKLSHESSNVGG